MTYNNYHNYIWVVLLLSVLALPVVNTAQRTGEEELTYELARVYPSNSISKQELRELKTIADLNKYYKPTWVREFKLVEILSGQRGDIKRATSKSETLTPAQIDLIKGAEEGSEITVNIRYIPENTLKHNDPKEFNFTFTIEPESDAGFADGEIALREYIDETVINKIPRSSFQGYAMAAVKFTIDEAGHVFNAHVFESAKDEAVDDVLLAAICNMPNWNPASYDSGIKVAQEFALIVGSMENCMIVLLNTRGDGIAITD